ncbi:hypothetical protein FQN50_001937 [Emmonsiellopsis sp. PD_5]|nr:hypothetical protein FQN50_001937 [Emmonsiellopsis sp. PD_5]
MDSSIQPTLDATSHPNLTKCDKPHRPALHPPQLSTILNNKDQLQPTPQQLETAAERCREYWHALVTMALSRRLRGIPLTSTNPQRMLNRIPAIRTGLGNISSYRIGSSSQDGKALHVQASSTWRITASEAANCGLAGREKEVHGSLQIGIEAPIPCRFEGDSFRRWTGGPDEPRDMPGYLGVLALGWSYILSARLVEMQGEGAGMSYTSLMVPGYLREPEDANAPPFIIDLGEVDEDAARWWAAILSPSEGWKAIISRRDDGEYLAPWSVSRNDARNIGIKYRTNGLRSENSLAPNPPSSSKAYEYLAQFSSLHNLGSQFLMGLTTAMTFPTHNFHGTVIQLPLPAESDSQQKNPSVKPSTPDWHTVNDLLPYYMTLSCSSDVVISILCGMFWEPDVTCNIVSPWLHPILREIPASPQIAQTPGLFHELLAIICSFRQPQVFPLWLGAVASGLTSTIIRQVARGRPPLDAHAFPWTGCPQSFMDIPGSGSYIVCEGSADKVRRADVWRLQYLPPVIEDDLHYNCRPVTPWAPFGDTTIRNCVFRVAAHLECQRHGFGYLHWNWTLEDGTRVEDQGYGSASIDRFPEEISLVIIGSIEDLEIPRTSLSREASFGIFQWVMVNGEGTPAEEVYKDDWLQFDDDSYGEVDAPSSNDDNDACCERREQLERWLDWTG